MAITQKAARFEYQAKLNRTGLTDVKATVELNGVVKASGLVLTEIDPIKAPGQYELVLSGAALTGYGVQAGQTNTLVAYIDSATLPAASIARLDITVGNTDDVLAVLGTPVGASLVADVASISSKLGTPAGASVSADVAAVKGDTAAIKADLETGAASLSTLLTAIQALQNASIGNGVGFVLPQMTVPSSGSQVYRIPVTILNDAGALVDPASGGVTVAVQNASGVDRSAYLTGATGSPGSVQAAKSSVGQYYVMLSIPSSAPEEELIFSFGYTLAGNATVRFGSSLLVADVQGAGYALQSTLLTTQTSVNSALAIVNNGSYGNAALQAILNNGTYGLSALQSMISVLKQDVENSTSGLGALENQVANIQAVVNHATYGNAALLAAQTANTQLIISSLVGGKAV